MIPLSDREGSWQSERWLPGQASILDMRAEPGANPPALWLWFPTYHIVTFTVIVCIGLLRLLYSPTLTRREDRVTEIRSDWFGRGEISRAGHNETLSDLGR
jgi:hypothetical protein